MQPESTARSSQRPGNVACSRRGRAGAWAWAVNGFESFAYPNVCCTEMTEVRALVLGCGHRASDPQGSEMPMRTPGAPALPNRKKARWQTCRGSLDCRAVGLWGCGAVGQPCGLACSTPRGCIQPLSSCFAGCKVRTKTKNASAGTPIRFRWEFRAGYHQLDEIFSRKSGGVAWASVLWG